MTAAVSMEPPPQVREKMAAAAAIARLPLRAGRWSGSSGTVMGQGTGNSMDFQDQRAYVPGDDPRHINWQAYARTGSYTMKLFRQEVSPRVDLIADTSGSMFVSPEKTQRTWELFYWCVESALRWGATLRVLQVHGTTCQEVPMEQVLGGRWSIDPTSATPDNIMPPLDTAPLRPSSLRILVSDLLYAGSPEQVTTALTRQQGRGIILSPYCTSEAEPDWSGNIDFEDSETAKLDKRLVQTDVLERYKAAYQRHFTLWREPCLKAGIAFARVPSAGSFIEALRAEALTSGAAEMG